MVIHLLMTMCILPIFYWTFVFACFFFFFFSHSLHYRILHIEGRDLTDFLNWIHRKPHLESSSSVWNETVEQRLKQQNNCWELLQYGFKLWNSKKCFLNNFRCKIFLHTKDKNILFCCCSSSTCVIHKDSSQSDGTPAKQKCTLNQGSLSYLAFISAGTKFTHVKALLIPPMQTIFEVFLLLSHINCTWDVADIVYLQKKTTTPFLM